MIRVPVQSSLIPRLTDVRDVNGDLVTGGTVSLLSITTTNGQIVGGMNFPVIFDEDGGGDYSAAVPWTIALNPNRYYLATVRAEKDGVVRTWTCPFVTVQCG